jgi:DNA-binding MarR family transcriptional regulator
MKRHMKRRRRRYRFPDDYLPYLVARASHVILREFHRLLRPRRMRVVEWRVLATLSAGGAYTVGALARASLLEQPTLSKLLDRLERRRLVRRAAAGMDLRQSVIELTARGRARIRPAVAQARRHERKVLRGFLAKDVQTFRRLLKAFTARLENGRA